MNSFKIIGMCGKSGSGKGYVAERLISLGIPAIDTDAIYRSLVLKSSDSGCLAEITEEFGTGVIGINGELDRKALSKVVFAPGAGKKLKKLNEITHKYILAETKRLCEEYESQGATAVVIDAPVLFESGFDKLCHTTFFVSCPLEKCVERISKRDSIDEISAKRRLSAQKSDSELRNLCDYEIINDGLCDVGFQLINMLNKILEEEYYV